VPKGRGPSEPAPPWWNTRSARFAESSIPHLSHFSEGVEALRKLRCAFMSEVLTNPYQHPLWSPLPSLAKEKELWPSARTGQPERLTLEFLHSRCRRDALPKPEAVKSQHSGAFGLRRCVCDSADASSDSSGSSDLCVQNSRACYPIGATLLQRNASYNWCSCMKGLLT